VLLEGHSFQMPVRKTSAEKKGVTMRRAMTLIVVMSVLLFSQLAFAEWEFHPGELTVVWEGEAQDQGLADEQPAAAAALKIVPLQAYTHPTLNYDDAALPCWNLDQDYYATVALRAYGSGDVSSTLTITDVKTGTSANIRYGSRSVIEGINWLTFGPSSWSGNPSKLPRTFILKYSIKVGTIVKSVSTKIIIE